MTWEEMEKIGVKRKEIPVAPGSTLLYQAKF